MTDSLQIKNGKYYCVLNLKDEIEKRKQKWIKTNLEIKGNKKKAEKILRDLLVEYANKNTSNQSNLVFTDCIIKWLNNKKDKVERNTWDDYKSAIENHIMPYFKSLDLKVKDLPPKHILDYYNYKFSNGRLDGKLGGMSIRAIKIYRVIFNRCLNNLVIDSVIDKNPALNVPNLKKKKNKQ